MAIGVWAGDNYSFTLPAAWLLLLTVSCCSGIILFVPFFRRFHLVRLGALALMGFALGLTLQVHALSTIKSGIIREAES